MHYWPILSAVFYRSAVSSGYFHCKFFLSKWLEAVIRMHLSMRSYIRTGSRISHFIDVGQLLSNDTFCFCFGASSCMHATTVSCCFLPSTKQNNLFSCPCSFNQTELMQSADEVL